MKVALFVVTLVAVFAAALGTGRVIGPSAAPADTVAAHPGAMALTAPTGLAVSEHGLSLVPALSTLPAGPAVEYAFTIAAADGAPVTAYDEVHAQPLHLIVVRRDLTAYQHVHPALGRDGRWTVALALQRAGSYRVFADFRPTGGPEGPGEATVLGVDLAVPGPFAPEPLPAATALASVDGYRVRLDGTAAAGRASTVALTISRDGAPIGDLQPYLGAYGHLVALREGDLAYLHVHPEDQVAAPADGTVPFTVEVPSSGRYRLFLDFRHDGIVRTAAFTLEVAS